jgi:hypothetical protein
VINMTADQLNMMFPVIGMTSYSGGIILKRNCLLFQNRGNYSHLRGVISVVNKRSLNRLALLVRSCGVNFSSFLTLSYGANYPMDGRVAKKDLNHMLVSMRRAFGLFEYVWVIEFQDRGACHFHMATTLLPPSGLDRVVFASLWGRISTPHSWPYWSVYFENGRILPKKRLVTDRAVREVHMHADQWSPIRKQDGVAHYFAKYANKLEQKDVPDFYRNIGRFWGASRGVRLPDGEYYHGGDRDVRAVASAYGRNLNSWRVLPKIILLG